jgi:hypothetical protein
LFEQSAGFGQIARRDLLSFVLAPINPRHDVLKRNMQALISNQQRVPSLTFLAVGPCGLPF